MHKTAWSAGRDGGVGLMAIAIGLMAIGVVAVFSAGVSLDGPLQKHGWGVAGFAKQAAFALCGFVALLALAAWPYQRYGSRGAVVVMTAAAALLLAAVLVPGVAAPHRGALRWLPLGPGISFQPSELAKLALVVFLAFWAARTDRFSRRFRSGLLPALAVAGLIVALIGVEDFGTAALLAVVAGLMLFVGGARLWHLGLASLPAAAGFGLLLVSKPYRLERLIAFTDIWADPRGSGYHAIQSLCSIASGGWWGKGLGLGVQKYGYLPEARNDFVFSIICEELGAVGGLAVIGLFAALVWLGARATARAPDVFGRMLAFGLTALIALQATMNIAVVTVWAPTKGIGLPLVSAGGSGVLFMAAAVGILANIARQGTSGPQKSAPTRFLLQSPVV